MTFRILSLDGGGIRGIVAARMLEAIEQHLGQPLSQYFDFITGTSTGAILAAGIAIGKSATDLRQLYMYKGKTIFPYQSRFHPKRLSLILRYGLSAPKFADDGLIQVIQEEVGRGIRLADISPEGTDSKTLLMIPSYDTVQRIPVIFKSWRHKEFYAQVPLWEACVCSASAPTYFPAHRLQVMYQGQQQEYSMIDGGVGANNPTACAVAEAIRLFRTRAVKLGQEQPSLDRIVNEISVLSLGTGDLTRSLTWQEIHAWGLLEWAPRIVDVIMDAPADIHRYIAEQIATKADTDHPECYLRLQPQLDQKFGAIDNATPDYLKALVEITDAYLATQTKALQQFLSC